MHADDLALPRVTGDDWQVNQVSERIIGCAFTVANTLRTGFLEKVYENALAHELRKAGLSVQQQHRVTVTYDIIVVGTYIADLVVEACALVEVKTVRALDPAHTAQGVNYLRAANLPLCLLLNFGTPRLQIKRLALT